MASSLTTSGFRPPFWPTRTGTSQTLGTISGSLFTDSDTFNDGLISSVTVLGSLLEDSDTLFHGVVGNRNQLEGSLLGDNIQVLDSALSNNDILSLNHEVDLPDGSHVVGRLVLVAVASDGAPTPPMFTWPSGWTEILDSQATEVSLGVAYKEIDGTEGFSGSNDTITVVTSELEITASMSYLIENFNSSNIEISSTSGTSTNPNPPSITPAGSYDNYLNIAINAHDVGTTTTTAYPSEYNNTQQIAGGGTTGCGIGIAQLINVDSSEDPGVFTISAARNWIAATVSIRSLENPIENEIFNGSLASGVIDGSLLANTNSINGGTMYFGTRVSTSQLGISGTAEDPGVYTLSQSQDWIACTVSIKGN